MDYQELSWRERGRLWLRLGIRLALTVLALVLLALLVPPLSSLFMPFLLALVLAWVLNPIVKKMRDKLGISRKILSMVLLLLLFAVAGGILSALIYNVVAELVSLAQNWRAIWNSFLGVMDELGRFLDGLFRHLPVQVGETVSDLLGHLVTWLQTVVPSVLTGAATAVAAGAGSFAMSVPSFAVSSVMFIMASYFITSDYPRLRYMVTGRLSDGMREFFGNVKRTAVGAFGGYVKAQLILSAVIFLILLLGFTVIGQPYSVLLAFLLAVLDFIPIVGSGTAMVPWAVIDLLTGNVRHAVELMVIWGVIALFRRAAEPKVVGDQTGLSPILSLISIYVGMKLGGVPGMILGPVLCMVLINIVKLGVLDGTMDDVRLAAGDLAALLKNRPRPGGTHPEEPPETPPDH